MILPKRFVYYALGMAFASLLLALWNEHQFTTFIIMSLVFLFIALGVKQFVDECPPKEPKEEKPVKQKIQEDVNTLIKETEEIKKTEEK